MPYITRILIILILSQSVVPSIVLADDGPITATGSTVFDQLSGSGTIIQNNISSGSVLHKNQNNDQQSNSSSGNTVIATPVVRQSPLIIRINEVAWMGSDLSTADEWVEFAAAPLMTGAVLTKPVNIKGWTLTIQKDSGESVIAGFTQDLFIGSGQYLVIGNNGASASRLKIDPAFISTAISLPNTKLLLRLRDSESALVDEVDDFVGAPFAGLNPSASSGLPKATMERISLRKAGNDKTNWKTATTSRGFDVGANMLGTPGFPNGSIEPPDITPPPEILHAQAYRFSGSTLIGWTNPIGSDASTIRLTANATIKNFPATATGCTMTGTNLSQILIQTVDSSGNVSSGITQSVQVLPPWIISEVLPDPPGTDDEWIELGNSGAYALDLNGWILQLGSKRFVLNNLILAGTSYLLLPAHQTGIQLPNAGGEVQLRYRGILIDHLVYTETPDGVSVGRHEDGLVGSFCVPTPGAANLIVLPTIALTGFVKNSPNPTSLNLAIKALSGSLAGASCSIDYGDGFVSNSCNPPTHAMKKNGHLNIKTQVSDYCGNTIIHSDDVQIVTGSKTSTTQIASGPSCQPTATGGIVVSEFLPAPAIGEHEWIELKNVSDDPINLCGWSVDDGIGGSHPYKLGAWSIDAHQYLLINSQDSKITLNNDADSVRLIAPDLHGGTGVLLSIPYHDAQTGISFALRDDGLILETQFPTPGSANRFTEIDSKPGSSPVIISAALPNPTGVDTWSEWLELTNVTGRPQWLNGWHIEDSGGHRLPLDGRVLAKRETQRILVYKGDFSLINSMDSLRLIDEKGAIRSVLTWSTAQEGKPIEVPSVCSSKTYDDASITDDLEIHARATSGSLVIFPLAGVLDYQQVNPTFDQYKFIVKNYISALIKDKKLVSKNCSDKQYSSLSVDHADIALLLLQNGLVFTDPTDTSVRHDEFLAYEQEAQSERLGMWADINNSVLVDDWRSNRLVDSIAANNGVEIKISPDIPLLQTGSVISVSTNVPTDLWVKRGTGAYRRFAGDIFVSSDSDLSFLAMYTYRTMSGGALRSTVATQSYAVKQASYPPCIRISEVYPSPKKGEHEWVELQNSCHDDLSLLGWTIDDSLNSGSKPFTINKTLVIKSESPLILSGALLPVSLNNGGDSVVLLSPDGRMQEAVTYGKVSTGKSVALTADGYCLTDIPTANLSNICVHKERKKLMKKSVNHMVAGKSRLTKKYASSIGGSSSKSTKNDQFLDLIEGLNRNTISGKNKREWVVYASIALFMSGLMMFSIGSVLYMKKYRLFQ